MKKRLALVLIGLFSVLGPSALLVQPAHAFPDCAQGQQSILGPDGPRLVGVQDPVAICV